jgi:hypothetical protein
LSSSSHSGSPNSASEIGCEVVADACATKDLRAGARAAGFSGRGKATRRSMGSEIETRRGRRGVSGRGDEKVGAAVKDDRKVVAMLTSCRIVP